MARRWSARRWPAADGPRVHYVSNVDPSHLHDVLAACDPSRTLVIVTSKTFTTSETIRNAALARTWLAADGAGMAAVTAAPEVAAGWGVDPDRVFDFDKGVGGRYSLWSAVGLPVMIGVGPDAFAGMLAERLEMDRHFRDVPAPENIRSCSAFCGSGTAISRPGDARDHAL